MPFRNVHPPIRRARGRLKISYLGGIFVMNRRASAAAGYPTNVQLLHDPETNEVLVKPVPASEDAFKLSAIGPCGGWRNGFASVELARRLGLSQEGEAIRFPTEWDPQAKVLRFRGSRPAEPVRQRA